MSELTHRYISPEITSQTSSVPIVLLHGWGLNSGVFDTLAQVLAQTRPVYLIDLPGFGNNAHVPLGSIESAASQVSTILPERCHLMGWSLGGLVAQQLALQTPLEAPDKLVSLLCVATSTHFVTKPTWEGIKPEVLSHFESELARDYRATVQRFLAIQAMGSPHAKADIQVIKGAISAYPEPCEASLLQGLKLLQSVDLSSQVHKISVPTLRLYGRLDALVPVAVASNIADLQPNAHTIIMEHVSHAPFISARETFVEHLNAFMQKSESTAI